MKDEITKGIPLIAGIWFGGIALLAKLTAVVVGGGFVLWAVAWGSIVVAFVATYGLFNEPAVDS